MSTAAVDALYAHLAPAACLVVCLSERDRRRVGDDFPTVPVDGLHLNHIEVAAALFETGADFLAVPVPDTDTLYDALKAAVAELGPAGIAQTVGDFTALDPSEFGEVRQCRAFAYRLALSFWYQGARSRPMTAGEAGVALYLSDLTRYRRDVFRDQPGYKLLLSRALHQGAGAVPTETLIRLGEQMGHEFNRTGAPRPSWLYKQALPDHHRRRFCYDLLTIEERQPSPLIVRLDDGGGYTLGLTPPPEPDGLYHRPRTARW
ncbi:hypothetical protein [Streptomyces sp. ODS05-4]|uniref:hypothetical protein n=1 Tax=Streptomyces sp. ODS05-4 TaxID=2944939 RepID=UPI00210E6B0C|nr:hypothetical protein [Streptomyces sp. ODS05-4]